MDRRRDFPRDRKDKKVVLGLVLVALGVIFLLKTLDMFDPFNIAFHLSWPVVLIIIGLLIGIRSKWRNKGSFILLIIGVANLLPVFYIRETSSRQLAWPAMLILLGLYVVFRKKKSYPCEKKPLQMFTNDSTTLNIDVTMGGRKEIVTSKDFRGGRISTTFGGTEVNLMQADGQVQPMVLDISVSFGSVELIVPSHWEVINEIRPSMGSVEDHRYARLPDSGYEKRTLYLRGSCSFGSVELKSY